MNRRNFSTAEISEALRALEAGVRVPEVCRRLGVSELTLGRWRHKAGLLRKPDQPVTPVMLDVEQANNRIAGLEHRLEALRQVLITMLGPEDLERAARLLEVSLPASAMRARRILGLPPQPAQDPAGLVSGEAMPGRSRPRSIPACQADKR
ncbi:MAG TPA: transposase [Anaeromyxobacteraceae bacterium]|nr:transposase [Anaeromyxobacteraceae bacterium]